MRTHFLDARGTPVLLRPLGTGSLARRIIRLRVRLALADAHQAISMLIVGCPAVAATVILLRSLRGSTHPWGAVAVYFFMALGSV